MTFQVDSIDVLTSEKRGEENFYTVEQVINYLNGIIVSTKVLVFFSGVGFFVVKISVLNDLNYGCKEDNSIALKEVYNKRRKKHVQRRYL